jgi:putative resolvase
VEYPDRLVRFGFNYLEQACAWMGVRIEVLEMPKLQEPSEELAQDLLTIVTVFAGRMYGYRAKGVRRRVAGALQEHMLPDGTSVEDHQTAPRSGGEP